MFMTTSRRRHALEAMQAELDGREQRVSELEARLASAERAAHEFVEKARYTLESASLVLSEKHKEAGEALASVAHVLPYVLSGRRHWDGPSFPESAESARENAEAISRAYGFELPCDPTVAVKSLFDLSSMLLVPSHSLPVEGLRCRYPVKGTGH